MQHQINAALLAARILATNDSMLQAKLEKYAKDMGDEVVGKALRLEEVGAEKY